MFFAIPWPGKLVEELHRATEPIREAHLPIRWIPAQNIHLTLRYLGSQPTAEVDAWVSRAQDALAALPPVEVDLTALAWFPSPRRARMLAAMVAATPSLHAISERLEHLARAAGLQAETRPFRPHLTVARMRRPAAMDWPVHTIPVAQHLITHEIMLVRSELRPEGAKYEDVAAISLSAADPSPS
ncbi:MAG: RNA 2',3'-cyclic phosphodiesterase [Pseudomonadota bacterium]|nr:RNA 2',3'-cyclic phosphodiesterase [Pseudomonadota bacterium]